MIEELKAFAFFLTNWDVHYLGYARLGGAEERLTSGTAAAAHSQLEELLRLFERHGLADSITATEKLLAHLPVLTYGGLDQRLREIRENFIRDCWRGRKVYIIDDANGDYVDAGFGSKVDAAFPDALVEIREAHTCYALGRNTASVFHFMRAVEHGLRAVAVAVNVPSLKLPLEYQEWGRIIEQVESAWDKATSPWGASVELNNARRFFRRVVSDLQAFKDDVRNVTMHARDSYDSTGALRVRNRVEEWFELLASKVAQDATPGALLDRSLFTH